MSRKYLKPIKFIFYKLSLTFPKLGFKSYDKQPDQQTWDWEYSNKKWDYLKDIEQASRYGVLIEYMIYFKGGGNILDIGCGDGVLFKRYQPYGFSKYVGIDISQAAIDELNKESHENALFVRGDAELYEFKDKFNVIIFNESIYYFNNPLKTLERISEYLEKGGVLIISTSLLGERGRVILNMINKKYRLIDQVKIRHAKKGWICSVFAPNKN